MSDGELFIHVDKEAKAADMAYSVDQLRALVRHLGEIDDDIKDLRDRRKRLVDDYVTEHNIPKKEVKEAIKMLKGDIDPTVTQEIYKEIADLVSI